MIESRTTKRFWQLFKALPLRVQSDARQAYGLFRSNPSHPGLHFKKLEGEDRIYSIRIGLDFRALGVLNRTPAGGARVVWYWIGSHTEYDRLV